MTARSGDVLHVVDSLGLGGTQTILKHYFESRISDRSRHLYGLRAVPHPIAIAHPNVQVSPSSLRFSMAPLGELRRIVQTRGISVLHCHLFRAQVFGFLLKTLSFPRITLVFHEHGRAVGREGESGLEALLFRWFLRLAWRRVDRFICISDYTRTRLLRVIPAAERSTSVLPNPIPAHPCRGETADREAIRRELAIPDGAFVVGFASRLVERKGWRHLLDALALLAPTLPVFLLMAGDGEERGKVEARIREIGLERRSRMLGHIDRMRRFYRCLDCFIMPSVWEPHGLAHLEAQSFGVPVVVSSVPGLGATVRAEQDALLFKAGDASALADCIRRLAGDCALRDRLVAGGLVNSGRYRMDAFAEGLDEIYAGVAGRRGAAGGK